MKKVIIYSILMLLTSCCFFEQFGDKETYSYRIHSTELVGEINITSFVKGNIIHKYDIDFGQSIPIVRGEPLKIDQLGDYGGPFYCDSLRIIRLSDSAEVTFVHYLIDTVTFIKYRDLHYFNRDIWLKEVNAPGSIEFEFTLEMVEKMGK